MRESTRYFMEKHAKLKFRHRLCIMLGLVPFHLFDEVYNMQNNANQRVHKFITDQVSFNNSTVEEFDALYSNVEVDYDGGAYA